MASQFDTLTQAHITFVQKQKIFFVATAMPDGHINLSPKGMDSFRILNPQRILWMNLTGSGNETATHLQFADRMTIMFCAFEGKPLILRLYGTARVYHERDAFWQSHIHHFPQIPGSRQLVDMEIEMVQTSCGTGVPLMDFREERNLLRIWAEKKGKKGLEDYHQQRNAISLDGHPTGILKREK
jgi:hypothetical protein